MQWIWIAIKYYFVEANPFLFTPFPIVEHFVRRFSVIMAWKIAWIHLTQSLHQPIWNQVCTNSIHRRESRRLEDRWTLRFPQITLTNRRRCWAFQGQANRRVSLNAKQRTHQSKIRMQLNKWPTFQNSHKILMQSLLKETNQNHNISVCFINKIHSDKFSSCSSYQCHKQWDWCCRSKDDSSMVCQIYSPK